MRERPRPFISYAHEDQAAAIRLYGDLRALGADPWLDAANLVAGQDWEFAIREALRNATHFIALVSHQSVNKRGFVQKELKQALDLLAEFPPSEIFLIPVRLESVDPEYEQLRKLHRVDLFPDRSRGIQQIAQSLGLIATEHIRRDTSGKSRRVHETTRAHLGRASLHWLSISVNDLLPEYEELAKRLADAQINVSHYTSDRGKTPPPRYSVVVAGSAIGIRALQHICEVVAPTGQWYLQIWMEDISAQRIAIGAYGYGGAPAARLDDAFLDRR